MDDVIDLQPFLLPTVLDGKGPLLSVKLRDGLVHFPPPLWSTVDDICETSGLLSPVPPGPEVMFFTPMDPQPDGYSQFRIVSRAKPHEDWGESYVLDDSRPMCMLMKEDRKVVTLSQEEDRVVGYGAAKDPFGRPKAIIEAFCLIKGESHHICLRHVEWFDMFNIDNENDWPLPNDGILGRVKPLERLVPVS